MPERDVSVGSIDNFPDGALVGVEADGQKVIVARTGDQVCAAVNRCPHLGFSLTRGPGGQKYADGVVQCPWHNSRFDVRTGENLDWASGFAGRSIPKWSRGVVSLGRKPKDLTTLPARVEDGTVVISVES